MAKITWRGEDERGGPAGPSFTIAHGRKFAKGIAVEVTDKAVIAKAQGNQFFTVKLTAEDKKEAEGIAAKPAKAVAPKEEQ